MFNPLRFAQGSIPLGLVLVLSSFGELHAQTSDTVVWRYSMPLVNLFVPAFSRDGDEIAVVRRTHIWKTHAAEHYSGAHLDSLIKRRETDPRWNDPQVVVLKIGKSEAEFIDWGWSPSFGPDGTLVAYAHQKRPLSGMRILASTLEGNEIRVFDRVRGEPITIAVPEHGFFGEPLFSEEGTRIAFLVGYQSGGMIDVRTVTLPGGQLPDNLPPQRAFNLNDSIRSMVFVADTLFVLVRNIGSIVMKLEDIPMDPTQGGSVAQRRSVQAMTEGIGERLLVFDRYWRPIEDELYEPQIQPDEAYPPPGKISPDGLLICEWTSDRVRVRRVGRSDILLTWTSDGEVQEIVWSSDSNRLAVIQAYYAGPDNSTVLFDELVVLQVR